MTVTHTGLKPGAFGSTVIDPEDHAQMETWGFVYSFDSDGYGRYDRTVDGGRQTLMFLVPQRFYVDETTGRGKAPTGEPGHWTATFSHVSDRHPELVVRYAEGFTSPVVTFVTAEVRGWRMQ